MILTAALCVLMGSGCSWLDKREGQSLSFCQECIKNSFASQKEGDIETAQQYLDAAIQAQPENAEVLWNLAELSIQQDNNEKAATELQKYIDLRPTDPQGYLRLAQLYYLQNQYTLADKFVQEALRRVPDNIDALMLSARLARKQGDQHQASTNYYHVLQIIPGQTEASLELSELLISQKEPSRATPMLRALARKSISTPEIARTHLNLGIAYGQMNRWEDAIARLETAHQLTSDPPSRDQYRLAYAHWKSGTSVQALRYLIDIADQGRWTPRAEALYSTITETVPNYGYPDRLTTVEYQSQEKQTVSLLSETSAEPLLIDQLINPVSPLAPVNIIPPEWDQISDSE
ncbi:MAG: tetratricopeptide repeat protein [Planctomycetaceae bacterium]|nr:tetratricopeptide repeat protein [Planctomycetaceae bacterium]